MASVQPIRHKHSIFGKGEFWALLSAIAYGADNVFASRGVTSDGQGLDPILGVIVKATPVMIFAIIMSMFIKNRDPDAVSIFSNWRYLVYVFGHGVLTFVIGNTLLFNAFRTGGVLVTTPLLATNVLWSALIAALVFKELLNRRMLAGMLVSIAGVFLLRIGQVSNISLPENWAIAVPLAIGAALSWALGGVLITYATRNRVDRFQALGVSIISGLLILNLYLLISGKLSLYATSSPILIGNVLIAGLFNTVALVSITSAMMFTSLASAGTLSSLQVMFAPLLAWIIFGEKLNLMYVLSIVLILGGVMLVQRAKVKAQTKN